MDAKITAAKVAVTKECTMSVESVFLFSFFSFSPLLGFPLRGPNSFLFPIVGVFFFLLSFSPLLGFPLRGPNSFLFPIFTLHYIFCLTMIDFVANVFSTLFAANQREQQTISATCPAPLTQEPKPEVCRPAKFVCAHHRGRQRGLCAVRICQRH